MRIPPPSVSDPRVLRRIRLPRLVRTSSFRLVLLYSGLFTASVLLLLAMVLWWAGTYLTQQTDQMVADELGDVQTAAAKPGSGGLRAVVTELARHASPGERYLLETPSGTVLAGNMPAMAPISGKVIWYPGQSIWNFWPLATGVRGAGIRTTDGAFLFVGRDSFALNELRETITHAFLSVILAALVLAVGGGVVMSLGSLRRVEEIGRTGQEIVASDLSRRLVLRGTDDEFDRLALSLNAMLDRIQSLMEGLNQVSSDIAHDLRTPLSRLRQRLELAHRRESDVDALRQALADSIRDVDAILDTFAALLRIAQIESHARESELLPMNLSVVAEKLVEFYAPSAEEHEHGLSGVITPGLHVLADVELLTQALANVIENALRHSGPGPITVTAIRECDAVVVEIADPGPGIPVEFGEKVFQRFFRLERSRTTPGTGLGLSLVAAVARVHQARVEFSGGETTFTVRVRIPSARAGAA